MNTGDVAMPMRRPNSKQMQCPPPRPYSHRSTDCGAARRSVRQRELDVEAHGRILAGHGEAVHVYTFHGFGGNTSIFTRGYTVRRALQALALRRQGCSASVDGPREGRVRLTAPMRSLGSANDA
eukprot:scaffold1233_cov395-Prasinococcus_capsulatus_cf.AAC.25